MSLPGIQTIFVRNQSPGNPQDLTAIPMVVGLACDGPLNTPTRIDQQSDLLNTFKSGPGVELAASILQVAGAPVYFTRALTSTPSTIGSVTKVYGNPVGTPVTSFGSVMVPGADANGNVLVNQKVADVTLTVVNPGAVTPATLVNVAGTAITVTLKHDAMAITETGTGLAAAINGTPAAFALVGAVAQGTGASLAGALALSALNNGALNITALAPGISYRVLLSGLSTPFSTSYLAGVITVTLATNASGEPTTTAATAFASLQALATLNPGIFSVAQAGTGALLLGAKPVTALPFGSTGTLATSGTPCDKYDVTVKIVKGGTVGGPTPIIAIWSADNEVNFSSQASGIVSPTGVLVLQDSTLMTGITVTLTGSFDVDDEFLFKTTAPSVSNADLLTAVDGAFSNSSILFGYLTSEQPVNRARLALLDGKVQSVVQTRFIQGLWNTVDIDVDGGQTEDQWMAALTTDFAGFVSANGLVSEVAGWEKWLSPLTSREWRRPFVFNVASVASSVPMHQALHKTNTNTAVLPYTLDIYHDEYKNPGLDDQRFITSRTYAISTVQNGYYITKSHTMADTNDLASTRFHWNRIRLATGYNLTKYLFRYIGDQIQVISKPESATVPAGAIAYEEAKRIEAGARQLLDVLYSGSTKTDGKRSVSDYQVIVPRNYNLLATGNLQMEVIITPLADIDNITLRIAINIPINIV